MKLSINNRYMALQGLYWMMFCAASGFISLYLQGRGLSSAGIGNVTAAFGMMAALLQPVLGRITDRDSRVTWRGMILSLTFPFLLVCLVMPLVKGTWSGALFMGLLILLSNTIMPFNDSTRPLWRGIPNFVGKSVRIRAMIFNSVPIVSRSILPLIQSCKDFRLVCGFIIKRISRQGKGEIVKRKEYNHR